MERRESGRDAAGPGPADAAAAERPGPAQASPAQASRAEVDRAEASRADEPREFRAAELAELAGITMRTLRYYRQLKLLPPPRLKGRTAYYDDHHLARLRAISSLLARGHTLSGIGELISAFAAGRDAGRTAELLGLDAASPWTEEERVSLSPGRIAEYYAGEATPENLAAALDIGYIAVDGARLVHSSRDLLEASSDLVKEGIPLSAMLSYGRELREHVDALVEGFTGLMREHLIPEVLGPEAGAPGRRLSEDDVKRLTETLHRVRPMVKKAVYAEVSLAIDRRVRAELEELGE
ncbi:MerR family transcriptional regulator [Streptomyces sp. B1866]|uniref:MerR family transcriptional regulator n=1 Tax=Streptomyces sp. B1866 TaxID=3075431 RepID=UPI002890AED3|nr:MerR family transcriptional regulator [Streptomyces sp. B1866]MDT3395118.1 MerR family transcriptional regulator [Streptomyces sp. B1866]